MAIQKKLLVLKISEPLYDSLKMSADISRRAFGHELALRIEYALNHFDIKSKGIGRVEHINSQVTNTTIQFFLREEIHRKLKTLASSLDIFIKEFTARILIESLNDFVSIASSENAVPVIK